MLRIDKVLPFHMCLPQYMVPFAKQCMFHGFRAQVKRRTNGFRHIYRISRFHPSRNSIYPMLHTNYQHENLWIRDMFYIGYSLCMHEVHTPFSGCGLRLLQFDWCWALSKGEHRSLTVYFDAQKAALYHRFDSSVNCNLSSRIFGVLRDVEVNEVYAPLSQAECCVGNRSDNW